MKEISYKDYLIRYHKLVKCEAMIYEPGEPRVWRVVDAEGEEELIAKCENLIDSFEK